MKKLLLSSILGGVIIFAWGAISHMATPLGDAGLKILPNEDAVLAALKSTVPEAGLYYYPGFNMREKQTPEQEAMWKTKYRNGPVGMLLYRPVGGEINMAPLMIYEFLSNVLQAAIAALIAVSLAGGYWKRVWLLSAIGLSAWVTISLSHWIWYDFPATFIVAEGVDNVVGAILAGLLIAKIIPPRTA